MSLKLLNMKRERIKNPFKSKCFRCKFIKCIDFFHKSKRDVGGEFYILYRTVHRKFPPCIVGSSIETLCKIGARLHEIFNETPQPIQYVLPQTVRDLKCSYFLALNGHYRNAFQTLRPAIENFLAGVYFQFLGKYEEFVKWTEGKYKIPKQFSIEIQGKIKEKLDYSFVLEFLVKKGILRSEWKGWVERNIFHELNKYLHPHFLYFELSAECLSCPAVVKYDEEELLKYLKLFQQIFWFIVISIFEMFGFQNFEKDKNVREALEMLTIQPEIIPKFIRSKEYEELLKNIRNRWEKLSHEVKQR